MTAMTRHTTTLSPKERRILRAFKWARNGKRTLTELAERCWSSLNPVKANSWTRNSIRRLVAGSYIEKVGKGTYRLTEIGSELAKYES